MALGFHTNTYIVYIYLRGVAYRMEQLPRAGVVNTGWELDRMMLALRFKSNHHNAFLLLIHSSGNGRPGMNWGKQQPAIVDTRKRSLMCMAQPIPLCRRSQQHCPNTHNKSSRSRSLLIRHDFSTRVFFLYFGITSPHRAYLLGSIEIYCHAWCWIESLMRMYNRFSYGTAAAVLASGRFWSLAITAIA